MDRWRTALFTAVQRVARGLELGARGLLCLAAGLLRRDQLARAIAQRWDDFGANEAHALSGLMPWEQEFYGRVLKPDDDILVVGCGTGRDMIALLRAGYQVEGLEPAARAAAMARAMLLKAGLDARLTIGLIEGTTIPKAFDVFIFSWFCYTYIPQRADRVAVLSAVRERLKPGGRVLISYLPCDRPPRRLPLTLVHLTGTLTRSGWRPEPTDIIELGARGLHFEHQFLPGELEDEARAAGLRGVVTQVSDCGTAVLTREEGLGKDVRGC